MSVSNAVKRLTRQGAMIDQEAAEIITEEDVDIIENLDVTPMYVNKTMIQKIRDNHGIAVENTNSLQKQEVSEYREITVSKEVPKFLGVDHQTYNLEKGETVEIPKPNAEILVNRGNAEYR